jgi:hypothetical protein
MKLADRILNGLRHAVWTGAFVAFTVPATAAPPIILRDQGSFMVGGTVITAPGTHDPFNPTVPDGQTFHGDHAYVQYQIPLNPRELPLVMWHGGGQFSKTWESTPDGRDGFQNIFIRRGFSTYIIDQPHRGRAGRSTVPFTITPVPGEQALFTVFRLGVWPNYFPGVQFPQDAASLEQYFRQQTPNTGPGENDLTSDAVAALFNKIGPTILLTHSASGPPGWMARLKSENVKAIISYEPVAFTFPEGEMPPALPTAYDGTLQSPGTEIPLSEFMKLTQIAIQVIFGDNIPAEPSLLPGPERWRLRLIYARQFVDTINRHGGDAELLYLPEAGLYGNTHFPFSDLNNREVADLLSQYLKLKGLDRRGGKK